MFLRAVLRPVVRNRASFSRFSSSTTESSNSSATTAPQDDQPIDIPNPFQKEKKLCILCKTGIVPDYKNVKLLSQFQSPYTGKIYGRHITGLCKQQQEKVEGEIVKAQACALMGFYHKDVTFLKDPKLFDPERPIRPHKY